LQKAHAFDYIALGVLVTVYLLTQAIQPFHRLFSPKDPNIQYPHADPERVPFVWLMIYSIAVPGGSIAAYCLLTRSAIQKLHVSLLGFGLSLMLAAVLTNIGKNAIGRPRPDFLARCKLSTEDAAKDSLLDISACTETDRHTLQDGWRSFPSGHSSFAFSGLGYLSLFLTGQLHALRGGYHSDIFRVIVCLLPLVGATMIAASRIEDYRHAAEDVLVGSALGFLCAWGCYRRFFPSLNKRGCNVPHPSAAEDVLRPGKKRDLETGNGAGLPDEYAFELDDDEGSENGADHTGTAGDGRGQHVPLRSIE
jgi:diacylglycerol diphosphate phosphatase / phosphatidate phosphatase